TLGDASGDTITFNADTWTLANDTNLTLSGGVNGLSFDTSTFSVDSTNDRIGIRTTAPSTVFEVQGTASASYLLTGNTLQVGGFASVSYNRFGTSATTNANYISASNDVFVSGDLDGLGSLSFSGTASLSNTLWVSPGGFTGNVGIGTTAPIAVLDIEPASTVAGPLFRVASGSNERLRVASDGNVGIGTTVPAATLDIQTSTVGGGAVIRSATGTNSASMIITNTSGSAQMYTEGSVGGFFTGGLAYAAGFGSGGIDKALQFGTDSTVRMTILGTSGNVGIGTTSPDSLLELSSGATNLIIRSTTSTSSASIDFQPAGGASASNQGKFTIRAGGLGGTTGERLDIINGNDVKLMTIASTGFVGIGTTNPQDTLAVNGNMQIVGANTNTGYDRYFKLYGNTDPATNPNRWAGIAVYNNGGNNVNELAFFTGTGDGARTEKVKIDNQGNVGIGTTGPTAKLTFTSGNNINLSTADASDNGTLQIFGGGGVSGVDRGAYINLAGNEASVGGSIDIFAGNVSTGYIRFLTGNSSEKVRIQNDGNVGIGTTAPDGKLHVHTATAGTITPSAEGDEIVAENSGNAGMSILSPDASVGSLYFGSPTSNLYAFLEASQSNARLRVGTNLANGFVAFEAGSASEKMRITSGGNVGIGTTAPLTKFAVSGGIASISQMNGADANVLQLSDFDGVCTFNPESAGLTPSCSSDARLKSNIVEAPSQLSYLTHLPIKQFTVNASGETKIGTIAQELLALPDYMDLVSSGSDGFYKVAEVSSWKLIKGIQELDLKMASLSGQFSIFNSQFSMNASISNVSNSLFQSIISMFKDAYEIVFEKGLIRVANIISDTITSRKITATEQICLDDICVGKDKFKAVFGISNESEIPTPTSSTTTTPEPSGEPTPSSTPEVTSMPSPTLPIPSPTPDVGVTESSPDSVEGPRSEDRATDSALGPI
ncbi:MAG: Uncharacterized protein G01um101444_345, partial [Parcubacteria group bacterium Gr01-1014_44]